MKDEIKIEANELHPDGIITAVVRSFKIEAVDLESCTAAVKALIIALATVILMLIKKELNISDDLQEYIDKMIYQSKMDSTNSSSRPSGDMPWDKPGRNVQKESVQSSNKESLECGDEETDEFEEEERESERKYRADHDRSLRKKTGRSAGKQEGAKGYGFKIPEDGMWNEMVLVPPDECANCPNWEECSQKHQVTEHAAHNVVDVKFIVEVTPYKPVSVKCPDRDGKILESNYPENATAPNQYGMNIQTLLSCLYIPGMISFDRIHDIFAPMFGLKVSQSCSNTLKQFRSSMWMKPEQISTEICTGYIQFRRNATLSSLYRRKGGRLRWRR